MKLHTDIKYTLFAHLFIYLFLVGGEKENDAHIHLQYAEYLITNSRLSVRNDTCPLTRMTPSPQISFSDHMLRNYSGSRQRILKVNVNMMEKRGDDVGSPLH